MWRAVRETSRIPILAVAAGTTVALEYNYSEVNGVADAYTALMLASKALEKEKSLVASMKRSVKLVDRRVQWSLQKYHFLHTLFPTADTDWAVYRLEWMEANVRGLAFQLGRQNTKDLKDDTLKKVSFEEESQLLYDTKVDEGYLDTSITTKAHAELEALLPGSEPLHKRHAEFQYRIMIPKRKYESVYRQLVGEILEKCEAFIPELKSAKVAQEYIDDPRVSCEAYVQPDQEGSPGDSKMVVNIARAISYDKAQQLAVHELTHHFQIVLMQQHLYEKCPEMRAVPDASPMGVILEGGAEAFVELYFNPEKGGVVNRVEDLKKRMPSFRGLSAEKILEVERITWFGLWSTIIRISRDYQNGKITKDECIRQMLEHALKRNDSWPNADFFDQVGAYTLGYGYGKELILEYCCQQATKNSSSVMEEYVKMMKRPLLPSQIQRSLSGQANPPRIVTRYWC